MYKFLLILLSLAFFESSYAYTTPPGIPSPSVYWDGLDPIEEVAPTSVVACPNWPSAASANCWYVDNTNGAATDTGNDYGYPDKPRMTLPEHDNSDPFPAGSYIQIANGDYDPFGGDKKYKIVFSGTSSAPCWFIFTGTARIISSATLSEIMIGGGYVFFDDWKIGEGVSDKINLGVGDNDSAVGSANHISIRELVSTGDGQDHGNGAAVSTNGVSDTDETEYVVVYNAHIHDWGSDTGPSENDFHGVLPAKWSEHVWVLSSSIHNNGGDAMQIGSNNYDGDERTQYIYVGNNVFHDDYENAVDIKQALDVIVSHNEFYGYEPADKSDGAACVSHRQNESGQMDGPERIWFIFNKIHDSIRGIRFQETAEAWAIGNEIYNITCNGGCAADSPAWDDGAAVMIRSQTSSGGVVDNTIHNCFIGVESASAPAEGWTITGNIFSGRTNANTWDIWMDTSEASAGTIDYNNMYSDLKVHFNGTDYTDITTLTGSGKCANCMDVDPLYVSSSDHHLQTTSQLIGKNTEDPIYSEFQTLYGLDIKNDLDGISRPQTGPWNMGAYEYDDGTTTTTNNCGTSPNSH